MNKYLVVYTSKTGNTKKIVEVARNVLGDQVDIIPVTEKPSPEGYQWLAVGFWIDQDDAPLEMQAYLEGLQDTKVALFCTLGTPPTMPQAQKCMDKAIAHLDTSNMVIGQFICQGRVAPAIAARVEKMAIRKGGTDNLDLFQKVIKSAESHPDKNDLCQAKAFFCSLGGVEI